MPPGDTRFNPENFPVWINHGAALFYGIPGNQYRGFKVADDTHGPEFDPTSGERAITQDALKAARELMELRFPGMKGAPLVESRVCQYENSPDSNFIVDQHPEAQNVWLVGGGSGHGYKHGPALGEYVAKAVRGELEPDPLFRLARFKKWNDPGLYLRWFYCLWVTSRYSAPTPRVLSLQKLKTITGNIS